MRFNIEIPDDLLSKNGAEAPSTATETKAASAYAASGSLSGGAAPDSGGAAGTSAAQPLSAGAAESDEAGLRSVSSSGALDGGAAPVQPSN